MRRTAIAVSLIAAVASTPLCADPVADFYKGKQIKFIVRTTPGGDYDQYTRLLARFMGKYIPGNPSSIVVERYQIFDLTRTGGLITGLIGIAMQPWRLLADARDRLAPGLALESFAARAVQDAAPPERPVVPAPELHAAGQAG